LAALQKQREALEKEEQALKAKSHDKILSKIVQMAKDAGLTASDISKAMDAGKGGKTAKSPLNTATPLSLCMEKQQPKPIEPLK
jgi:DNA-binding protein H-NS